MSDEDDDEVVDVTAAAAAAAASLVSFKLRTKSHGEVVMRMSAKNTFKKLMDEYRAHAVKNGWAKQSSRIVFRFDDEDLEPGDVPTARDMEDGDVIDVIFK